MTTLDLTWLVVGVVSAWGIAVFLFLYNINANLEEIKKHLANEKKEQP